MKIINEKGQLFGAVNLIDLLVIVVVIGGIFVCSKMLGTRVDKSIEPAGSRIVTIELAKKPEYIAKNVIEGDLVMDKVQNVKFGKVISASYAPAKETSAAQQTGEVKTVNIPERYDITLKVEVPGDSAAEVGKLASIYTKHFMSSGYVMSIEEVEAQ